MVFENIEQTEKTAKGNYQLHVVHSALLILVFKGKTEQDGRLCFTEACLM